MKAFLIVIIAFLSAPALAELYICKDNGKTKLLSAPQGDDCRLQKFRQREQAQPRQAVPLVETAPPPEKKAAPKSYPVISAATQKLRDKKRGQILLYELDKEQQRQQTTAEQIEQVKKEAPDNELLLAHLETQLHIHTQNIIAIKQELARL